MHEVRTGRVLGISRTGKATVEGGRPRPCTVGLLFSKTAWEEPITTRENRLVIGLDREVIAGRGGGAHQPAVYTDGFVQSRRTGRSRRRCRRGGSGSG